MKARLSYLSYEKRPTSGDITYIRTLRDDVDAIALTFKSVMVLVVLSRGLLHSRCQSENKKTIVLVFNSWYFIKFCTAYFLIEFSNVQVH